MSTRIAKTALTANAALVVMGVSVWIAKRYFDLRADDYWALTAPIVFGTVNVSALCVTKGAGRLHGLVHLWALLVLIHLPFALWSTASFLEAPPPGWIDTNPPTRLERGAIILLFTSILATFCALGFSRFFRPGPRLSLIVIPLASVLLVIAASLPVQKWLEGLVYGPMPDGANPFIWGSDHFDFGFTAAASFMSIWVVYFVVGAYRGIPRHSDLTRNETGA